MYFIRFKRGPQVHLFVCLYFLRFQVIFIEQALIRMS